MGGANLPVGRTNEQADIYINQTALRPFETAGGPGNAGKEA